MKKYLRTILVLAVVMAICLALCGSAFAADVETAGEASGAVTDDLVSGVFADVVAQYVMPLLKTVLMTIASAVLVFIGRIAGKCAAAILNTLFKREIARTAMKYVEQKYKDIHGEAKLNKALEKASELLKRYHIDIDVDEMTDLIEAAVGEFNAAYKKDTAQLNE